MNRLKRVLVPRPPSREQTAIIESLSAISTDVTNALKRSGREITLLHQYRTRLIADVVTGKLDVRAAAARLPDEVPDGDDADDADGDAADETAGLDDADVDVEPDSEVA